VARGAAAAVSDGGDFLGAFAVVQRRLVNQHLHDRLLLHFLAAHRRVDDTRRNRCHPRAARAEAGRFPLDQQLHAALGDRVGGAGIRRVLRQRGDRFGRAHGIDRFVERRALHVRGRGSEQNGAVAFRHVRQDRFDQPHRRGEIDFKDARGIGHGRRQAGAVDQRADRTAVQRGGQAGAVAGIGDVAGKRLDLARQAPGRIGKTTGIEVAKQERPARFRQQPRRGFPHSRCCAGDYRNSLGLGHVSLLKNCRGLMADCAAGRKDAIAM